MRGIDTDGGIKSVGRKQIADCLFCGCNPCECRSTSTKPKPAKPKLTPKPAIESQPLHYDEVKESTSSDELFTGQRASRFDITVQEKSQDELIFEQALRNLEPILSPQTKMRFRDILAPQIDAMTNKKLADFRRSRAAER